MHGFALVLPAAAACYLLAAATDVAARVIPDRCSVALVLLTLAHHGLAGGATQAGMALAVGAAVFLALSLLCMAGVMGGGDAKLLGASAALLGPALLPEFLLTTALAGGALSLAYLLAHRLMREARTLPPAPGPRTTARKLRQALAAERRRVARAPTLPYGVAIAAGALGTAALAS